MAHAVEDPDKEVRAYDLLVVSPETLWFSRKNCGLRSLAARKCLGLRDFFLMSDDLDRDEGVDLLVELDLDLVRSEASDGLFETNVAPVDRFL